MYKYILLLILYYLLSKKKDIFNVSDKFIAFDWDGVLHTNINYNISTFQQKHPNNDIYYYLKNPFDDKMKNYLFKEIIDLIKYLQDKNTIGIITANDKMDKQNIVTELDKLGVNIDIENIEINPNKNDYLDKRNVYMYFDDSCGHIIEAKDTNVEHVIWVDTKNKSFYRYDKKEVPDNFCENNENEEKIRNNKITNFTKIKLPKNEIKLITWNVYYDIYKNDIYRKNRTEIEKILKKYDIICVQETKEIENLYNKYYSINFCYRKAGKYSRDISIYYNKNKFYKSDNYKCYFVSKYRIYNDKVIKKIYEEKDYRPILGVRLQYKKMDKHIIIITLWGIHGKRKEHYNTTILALKKIISQLRINNERIIICGDSNEFSLFFLKNKDSIIINNIKFYSKNNEYTCYYKNIWNKRNTPLYPENTEIDKNASFSIILDSYKENKANIITKRNYSDHLPLEYIL